MARYMRVMPISLLGALVPSLLGAQASRVIVGGEVDARLEVEGRRDQEDARAVGRVSLRPTISLDGGPTVGFDVLLGTPAEAPGSLQPEQYSVGLDWRGAQAGFGHVKQSYSRLAVQDVSVQGGRFFVERRGVRLSAFGGRSDPGGAPPSPFERHVEGGRVGVGDPESTAFDVILIRARDELRPLAASSDDSTAEGPGDGITAQQSLVVGAMGSAAIFDRALSFRGEIMRSALTPDPGAIHQDGEVPDSPVGEGSRVDYARSLEATARLASLTATVRYRSIGAEYQSPGVRWLPTDRREVGLSATWRVADWEAVLNASRERDNLSGEEALTTAASRVEARLALPSLKGWSTKLQAEYRTRGDDAAGPDDRTRERTWILGTNQELRISEQGVLRSASMGYGYEVRDDGNPLRVDSGSDAHALNVELLTSPADELRVLPSFRLVSSGGGPEPRIVRRVYVMQAQHHPGGGRLRLALDVRRTEHPEASWWEAALTSRLTLGDLDR